MKINPEVEERRRRKLHDLYFANLHMSTIVVYLLNKYTRKSHMPSYVEKKTCPRCTSNRYFVKARMVRGMQAAPLCYDCGYNGGHFHQYRMAPLQTERFGRRIEIQHIKADTIEELKRLTGAV